MQSTTRSNCHHDRPPARGPRGRGGWEMLVSFELSMPGNSAWNGRWSGDGVCYAQVRSYRKALPFKLGYYDYDFGDGWRASVTVREITSTAATKLRKQSQGFCGYDWMID